MKALHLFHKLILRVKNEGLKDTLKEFIFFNRIMVVVEKDIRMQPSIVPDTMYFDVIENSNIQKKQKKYNLKNIKYHCKERVYCCMLFSEDQCVGYQLWTDNPDFPDLRKLDITLGKNEAYQFDLFVFKKYRGTDAAKILNRETDNHLSNCGIKKTYGFYFLDNLASLWWHRIYLKCREIRRVKSHRVFFLDITNNKPSLNL